jgi:hypothetical protein
MAAIPTGKGSQLLSDNMVIKFHEIFNMSENMVEYFGNLIYHISYQAM